MRRKGTVQLLDHLKKGGMATEAERLLKDNGWLPEAFAVTIWQHSTVRKGRGRLNPFPTLSTSKMLTFPRSTLPTCQAIKHDGGSVDYNPAAFVRFTRNRSRRRW